MPEECPIATTYLLGVKQLLSAPDNELMYEHARGEVNALWLRSKTAGNDTVVQHLRGFVTVELMATTLWRTVLPDGGDTSQSPYVYEQFPKIKLAKRTPECLTGYLDWLHEQLPERTADNIYARHYSVAFNKEQQAARTKQAMDLLGLCAEAAELLRTSLKNHARTLARLGELLTRACEVVRTDAPARIKYARYLLDVTHEHAPRGWEFK